MSTLQVDLIKIIKSLMKTYEEDTILLYKDSGISFSSYKRCRLIVPLYKNGMITFLINGFRISSSVLIKYNIHTHICIHIF